MQKYDFAAFDAMLDEVYALTGNGQLLSAGAKALFFRAMEEYTLEDVRRAMTAHVKDPENGKFQPKPAHLIAQLQKYSGGDGWLGAEEAWAKVPKHERDSAMVTNEMMQAFATCEDLLNNHNDKIAARMAFKEQYEKLVQQARLEGRRPVYFASLGADILGREKTLSEAVLNGLMTINHALELQPMSAERLLLATNTKEHPLLAGPNETGRKKIRELMVSLRRI